MSGLQFLVGLTIIVSALTNCLAVFNESRLVEIYSGVQNWSKFSRRYDITRQCAKGQRLRITYISRHAGTLWDFIAVAAHLNVSYTVVHPGLLYDMTPYRTDSYETDREFSNVRWRAAGQTYCHMADILMFGDVIADARGLLQGNCTTPMILQVTNRFDLAVADGQEYFRLMAQVVRRPNVFWVLNNPYEKLYMKVRGVRLPEDRSWMIRPVGISLLPRPAPDTYSERADKIAFPRHSSEKHLENTFIHPWINAEGMAPFVIEYPQNYGGPAVLAQHRGVIAVPYQVSVMKFYEGLAAGAAFIVPSPTFFMTLTRKLEFKEMAFCCREVLTHHPDDWQEYVDWYHEDLSHGLIYYDSWEELKAIIKGEGMYTPHFFNSKKRTARQLMMHSRQRSLDSFDQVYAAAAKYACDHNGQPDVFSAGMAGPVAPGGVGAAGALAAGGSG